MTRKYVVQPDTLLPPGWEEKRESEPAALPSYWPAEVTAAVVAEARWADRELGVDVALWERWHERALVEGIDEELAALGRSLMREAWLQGWAGRRERAAGLLDDGAGMLLLAMAAPKEAARRWRELLEC